MKRFLIIVSLILFSIYPYTNNAYGAEDQWSFDDSWPFTQDDLKHAKDAKYWMGRERWIDANQHAKKADNPIVSKLFRWLQYRSGSRHTKFEDVAEFISNNPQWPQMTSVNVALEKSIDKNVKSSEIVDFYTIHKDSASEYRKFKTPITATGKRLLADAIISMGKKKSRPNKNFISQMVRESWIDGDFNRRDALDFLDKHGKIIREIDDEMRVERLLWDGKEDDAKAMLKRIKDKGKYKLFNARVKLQNNDYGLDAAIKVLPKEYINDEGLLYDRVRWRMKRGSDEGVVELLKLLPETIVHPKKWWKIKRIYIEKLIENKEYNLAYELASKHSFKNNIYGFADGEWKAGWIATHYLKDPRKAYHHFYRMFNRVQSPISLGKASYWAARMAEDNENAGIAKKWYNVSSRYSSSFYGQLATEKTGHSLLSLPEAVVPRGEYYEKYKHNELLKAAYLLDKLGMYRDGRKFIQHAVNLAENVEEKILIATFGNDIGRMDYGVIAAKTLSRGSDTYDIDNNYPIIEDLLDVNGKRIKEPEEALIHSITLQESMFDHTARSHAGAMGMMQLMPATAKEVARRSKIKFDKKKIYTPAYNMTLGSNYLASLIKYFKGSYILAIASYNGGQGNVGKWIKANGDPREMKTVEEVVDWLEKIPFSETQNYVQRVIENLQIYRYKINQSSMAYVHTSKDITR